MFAIRLCVFLYMTIRSEGNANALKYKKQWAGCSSDKPFLILRNIVMDKCVSECNIRTACLAVNYWTRRFQCDMLLNDTESPLQDGNNTQPCVFVKKTNFDPAYGKSLENCTECNGTTACDIGSGQCEIRECRQLLVPTATIKGNILSVGSKIRIYCNEQFAQSPNETLSICQKNGTWSNEPTCHYLYACAEPPTIANAKMAMDTRAVGDVVNYTCNVGFVNRNAVQGSDISKTFIQCQDNGTWTHLDFQCIAGLCEPLWVKIGDSCYFADESQTRGVLSAQTFCNSQEACLVELDTDAEWDDVASYLYTTLLTSKEWWVGLTDVDEDNTWHWMSTDKVPNVDIRWDFESNFPGEKYARMVTPGKLKDCGSSDRKYTMCEKSTIP